LASKSDFCGEVIEVDAFMAFSDRYLAAWNSHDPTKVAGCATEDVVWDSPALPEPGRGRASVADLVATTATAFPDYEFAQPSAWAIAEDHLTAYLPWRMTGTNTGSFDPPGYAPTGRSINLTGIDVFRFRDGLIWRYQSVYNYSLVARQMGLGLPRGGKLERAAVRAQRVFASVRF
jgi:steroid delta-isomerase-like uncharacterized protein